MPFAGVEIEHYACVVSYEDVIFRSAAEREVRARSARARVYRVCASVCRVCVCTGCESIEALGHVYRRRLVCSLPTSRKGSLGLFSRR